MSPGNTEKQHFRAKYARADKLLAEQFAAINHRNDELFAFLMILQWIGGICGAVGLARQLGQPRRPAAISSLGGVGAGGRR